MVMDCPNDLTYYEMAWDMILATETHERAALIRQALAEFDHDDLVVALTLAGLTMKHALDYTKPTTPKLRADFLEMALQEMTP